ASQEWGKVDPAIAWHLIERHADSWADIGKMMTEYVQAQIARAELEARKPLPLSDDDRLRLRSDVARAIWDVMREHEDRCGHALEDVDHKHQVWDCADAAIRAMKDKP
ncbi:MAG: hypothetical protein LBJ40_12720, partial [Delftia acidovorans]|nr:hypothetical protein [Delftia acidovorans]